MDGARRMTGNKSYSPIIKKLIVDLLHLEEIPKEVGSLNVLFCLSTVKLDFKDMYFVKELKFNLSSVSQMCDKKNRVLFTDTECVVLSPDFKLLDENHVLLRVPRKDNMYSVDLKNIIPLGGLTCLFAKATFDESNLWHRRLGHINFKTLNKLVKRNLVRGVVEWKNRTLIKAARTMLADSKLPTTLWAEVVNTACYVQNMGGVSQTNANVCTEENIDASQDGKKLVPDQKYILLPLLTSDPLLSKSFKDSPDVGFKNHQGRRKRWIMNIQRIKIVSVLIK
ncbi:ribonuclease H-like domain-containing protein [Tanacetum coccineum]